MRERGNTRTRMVFQRRFFLFLWVIKVNSRIWYLAMVVQQFDASRRGKKDAELFSRYKSKARTVVGREKSLLCDPRSELRLGRELE